MGPGAGIIAFGGLVRGVVNYLLLHMDITIAEMYERRRGEKRSMARHEGDMKKKWVYTTASCGRETCNMVRM